MLLVALRKESVDRNSKEDIHGKRKRRSLSARRAWIEIVWIAKRALETMSLSARRAWIEIRVYSGRHRRLKVALRKESVDRNCVELLLQLMRALSLSARRAWIEISCDG